MNSTQTKLLELVSEEPINAIEAEILEYRQAYLEHAFIRAGKSRRY